MENKKSISFPLLICAIIIGVALFKQFDFQTLKFEKPWLVAVYLITFAGIVYVQIKNVKSK
ncbi:hypothetical protein GVN16_21320 [Emticicia sp. CRIBPO]|uniref:hypothetical protein n=1 Tax=Emticicia sp. CRIBPO TaxID=2683258 RepID=UPI001412B1C7|nr:hypothetical protein [Emticicia sp. CRIBPO]NBA88327.1 hypothetical protein [Emticicia sp. CRIBPO]